MENLKNPLRHSVPILTIRSRGNCCTLIEYGFVRIKTEEIQLLSDRADSSDKSD